MRLSTLHRTTAAALLGLFFVFIVGIPVVQSLCPMMEMNGGLCPMHQQGCNNGVSFTSQSRDCCSAKLVAERNTTPFVKFEEKKTFSFEQLPVVFSDRNVLATSSYSDAVDVPSADSSPPQLFLLNSSFLI